MKKLFGILLATAMLLTNALAFTDVPSSHWATKYITSMADIGVVSGVGGDKFDPESEVSTAQFVTMIVRHYYEDNLKLKILDTNWYVPFISVANELNLLEGVSSGTAESINRYNMAQIIYNTAIDLNRDRPGTAYELEQGEKKIADWSSIPANYREAVAFCYTLGLLSGVDDIGTFNGAGLMTRAQAAVVMNALINGPVKAEPEPQPE